VEAFFKARFVAVIAGFPAREVVIAVLGTVYAVGDDADEATLSNRLRASTWPDGLSVALVQHLSK
jgi:ferrous iron transport protein B